MNRAAATTLFVLCLATPALALDQVVSNCANDDGLLAAFEAVEGAGGGTITFSCGVATIELNNPLVVTAPTTIDGGGNVTLSGGNSTHLVEVAGDVTATLDSIDLTDGKGPLGGAIFNEGNLTLSDVTITSSNGTQDGGAVANLGNLTITGGSVLTGNEAAGSGGAIFAQFGLTMITGSEISSNLSKGSDAGAGGAVALYDGADLVVTGSSIDGNSADRAGAIFAEGAGSTVTITLSSVADNHTIDGAGGAIALTSAALSITDSTISGNEAINGPGGGIALTTVASATIRRSTIFGNSSTMSGGGLSIEGSGGVTIENTTFGQNGALVGGGVFSLNSTVSIDQSTFVSNIATLAGASFANTATSATLTLRNAVLATPVASPNCSDDVTETTVSLGGNLSADDSCAALLDHPTDVHETDPMLAEELADNGGPTLTYLPLPGSPVVDTGVASTVETDQRGILRPQGEAFDRGAVEVAACPGVVCGDANDSGTVSATDALAALRTAVGSATCEPARCDYDGSGEIQASDALAILRASVGQPTTPACPEPFDCRDE